MSKTKQYTQPKHPVNQNKTNKTSPKRNKIPTPNQQQNREPQINKQQHIKTIIQPTNKRQHYQINTTTQSKTTTPSLTQAKAITTNQQTPPNHSKTTNQPNNHKGKHTNHIKRNTKTTDSSNQ